MERVNFSTESIVKTVIVLFICYLLYELRSIVLAFVAAVVLASTMEPAARFMENLKIPILFPKKTFGIPRIVTILSIYVLAAGFFSGIVYFIVPELVSDVQDVIEHTPELISTILPESQLSAWGINSKDGIPIEEVVTVAQEYAVGASESALGIAGVIFGSMATIAMILVVALYLAVQKDGIVDMLKIIVPYKYERYAISLWKRAQTKIGLWLQGQLLLGLIIFLLTFAGLSFLGVKNALLLSILAGLFELIPVIGPVMASIPAIAFGYSGGGAILAVQVAIMYLVMQQLENHLLQPVVVKKMTGVPPIIAILSLVIGAKLAGFLGILISVPIATALMEFINDIDEKKQTTRKRAEDAPNIIVS